MPPSWPATAAASVGDAHSAVISDEAPVPASIQNAASPAAPGRSMRAGLSRSIVAFGNEEAKTATMGPISPAPTAERSCRADRFAADSEMTSGGAAAPSAAAPRTVAVVPAANVTTATVEGEEGEGAAPLPLAGAGVSTPSTVTTKASPSTSGNVPLTSDRSIDGDVPVMFRAIESAVMWTGAVPLALTDAAAGAIRSSAGAAAAGLPATSSNEPPATVTVPDAPPASAGVDRVMTRERPVPSIAAMATAAAAPEPSGAATERSAASTPETASSNVSENDLSPSAAARTALGACPSDAARGVAVPPKMYPAPDRGATDTVPVASGPASAGSKDTAWTADSSDPPTAVTVRGVPPTVTL